MKFTITDIQYDTDDSSDLPKELSLEVSIDEETCYEDVENILSDYISDETGFCHTGYAVTPEIESVIF